jgi:hypothetical protein
MTKCLSRRPRAGDRVKRYRSLLTKLVSNARRGKVRRTCRHSLTSPRIAWRPFYAAEIAGLSRRQLTAQADARPFVVGAGLAHEYRHSTRLGAPGTPCVRFRYHKGRSGVPKTPFAPRCAVNLLPTSAPLDLARIWFYG